MLEFSQEISKLFSSATVRYVYPPQIIGKMITNGTILSSQETCFQIFRLRI